MKMHWEMLLWCECKFNNLRYCTWFEILSHSLWSVWDYPYFRALYFHFVFAMLLRHCYLKQLTIALRKVTRIIFFYLHSLFIYFQKEVSRLRSLVNGGVENLDNDTSSLSFLGSPGQFKWEGLHGSSSPLMPEKRMSQVPIDCS